MNTIVIENDTVQIPDGIRTLDSFRRWFHSPAFPETGRICFLQGEVWVDMSKEQIFSHNQVKQEYNLVLGGLAKTRRRGRSFPDGLLVTNEAAGLCAHRRHLCFPGGLSGRTGPSQ